jgi:hypothetical protein
VHVLVLDTGNPTLSRALTSQGHTLSLLVPLTTLFAFRADNPGVAVHGIRSWTDTAELDVLASTLPDVEAIVTMDEQAIVAAAYLRHCRNLPGQSVDSAVACTNKHAMKVRLAAAGLPVAAHRVLHHADEIPAAAAQLGWPVICKPLASVAAINTLVLRDEADLARALREGAFDHTPIDTAGRFGAGQMLTSLHDSPAGFQVEAYLNVYEEFFCDVYLHADEILLTAVGRYNEPLLQVVGHTEYDTVLRPEHPHAEAVAPLAVQAVRALGLATGIAHCEILRTRDGRWWVGEVGARFGGARVRHLTNLMYGLDDDVLAALALGHRPQIAPRPRYRALTALMPDPEPGIVRSMASARQLAQLPGVVDVDLNLIPGHPVPSPLGTVKGTGAITFEPPRPDPRTVQRAALALMDALALQIEPAEVALV